MERVMQGRTAVILDAEVIPSRSSASSVLRGVPYALGRCKLASIHGLICCPAFRRIELGPGKKPTGVVHRSFPDLAEPEPRMGAAPGAVSAANHEPVA